MSTVEVETRQAILLAENNLQSSLLKDSIEQKVDLHIKLVSPERLSSCKLSLKQYNFDVVIVDHQAITDKHIERYQDLRETLGADVQEVLINTSPDLSHADMLKWQHLVGIFYSTDNLDKLVTGFECILRGEMWMSRKLVFEYIKFYRGRQCAKTSPYYSKLTKREQQIIKLLGDGASNTQIADSLFVSENTVKAHLHNTFKKIKVKNRLQALLWAKNNIASNEFV
ncbi:LuxR C-terminal-related transcriptional regulator [Vibrio sp. ZSDZ65]|uniref:LuxR C-terminal-related transcriptional regulator n=1 Tax=Vibrio qingdaonensis TaxID=2829491 RepID=A0A9X3CLP0_9VIBR|nr:LuxR C-terminal-related transcriptional regulator [Vibrio qingdaonensis]MCW8345707.1 LuxR C-terminal-related transcriptional regulator [Vibrio qingdaonensis]